MPTQIATMITGTKKNCPTSTQEELGTSSGSSIIAPSMRSFSISMLLTITIFFLLLGAVVRPNGDNLSNNEGTDGTEHDSVKPNAVSLRTKTNEK